MEKLIPIEILHIDKEYPDLKIDIKKEIANLKKEVENCVKMRDAAMFRLNNKDFREKASEEVIAEHNKRVEVLSDKISKSEYIIRSLESMK